MNNKDRLTQADRCRRRIQANRAYRPKIKKRVNKGIDMKTIVTILILWLSIFTLTYLVAVGIDNHVQIQEAKYDRTIGK